MRAFMRTREFERTTKLWHGGSTRRNRSSSFGVCDLTHRVRHRCRVPTCFENRAQIPLHLRSFTHRVRISGRGAAGLALRVAEENEYVYGRASSLRVSYYDVLRRRVSSGRRTTVSTETHGRRTSSSESLSLSLSSCVCQEPSARSWRQSLRDIYAYCRRPRLNAHVPRGVTVAIICTISALARTRGSCSYVSMTHPKKGVNVTTRRYSRRRLSLLKWRCKLSETEEEKSFRYAST